MATTKQNNHNSRERKNTSSKYKGVGWHKLSRKWAARITNGVGGNINIGLYCNEDDAAKAYDAKAKELFGDFAYLNFKS